MPASATTSTARPSTSGGSASRRDALEHDHTRERDQRRAVQLGRQDLGAPEAEREAAARGPPREPRREQRERDRAGVGEHVRRVREQRERVGQDAAPRPPRPSARGSARARASGGGCRPCGRACAVVGACRRLTQDRRACAVSAAGLRDGRRQAGGSTGDALRAGQRLPAASVTGAGAVVARSWRGRGRCWRGGLRWDRARAVGCFSGVVPSASASSRPAPESLSARDCFLRVAAHERGRAARSDRAAGDEVDGRERGRRDQKPRPRGRRPPRARCGAVGRVRGAGCRYTRPTGAVGGPPGRVSWRRRERRRGRSSTRARSARSGGASPR